jgi:hypothetical protein
VSAEMKVGKVDEPGHETATRVTVAGSLVDSVHGPDASQ